MGHKKYSPPVEILKNTKPVPRFSLKTMSDVRRANIENGHFFFSRDTMRFFSSKIESSLLQKRYFIDSTKQDDNTPREYHLRVILFPYVDIWEAQDLLNFNTIRKEDKVFHSKDAAKDFLEEHLEELNNFCLGYEESKYKEYFQGVK